MQAWAELGIDGSTVLDAQVSGLPRDTGHPPLGHLAPPQGGEALRQLVDQRLRQSEQSGPFVRGLHPGQSDLVRDAPAESVLTPPGLDLLGALGRVEGHALRRLGRRESGFDPLHRAQSRDLRVEPGLAGVQRVLDPQGRLEVPRGARGVAQARLEQAHAQLVGDVRPTVSTSNSS